MRATSFVRRVSLVSLTGGVMLALSACGGGGISEAIGFGKRSPDEFSVTAHRPLSLPPDFALRPPAAGSPQAQAEADARESARTAVFRAGSAAGIGGEGVSGGEIAILNRMNVGRADPEIRTRITEEAISDLERRAGRGFLGL